MPKVTTQPLGSKSTLYRINHETGSIFIRVAGRSTYVNLATGEWYDFSEVVPLAPFHGTITIDTEA